ncbi:RNA-guided endonuclease TnpB family protein [Saccharopolyspora sp. TS4A08]|uniref:RNA-guided endonuclease TnpB family protein n=1 Tax=Saccharopolyspora ipomoeae TaxID=3042027 RepID=A0ABT6PP59_9PSEU|nr:RNA-guided endonuclease TnpB family protein [Saccharopolyspora sp. TS4A08]MDI2029216.1 RNA-guided endonuclease TnpB family protein [Saccharopolyspora sp. TS4A08]
MGKTLVKRSYKYRFYPTVAQRMELLRTFGCVRKVYNLALEARSRAWADDRRHVNYSETSAMLTSWKKSAELAYLAEVSSVPLQQALRHLQSAFNAFFSKRSKYPRFKSKKRTRASAEYTRSAFRYSDGVLKLAKMTEPLSVVWSRPLPDGAVPSTVTVWRDSADRWFVSILVESVVEHHLPTADAVGLDAGITTLLTLSTGEKITNPKHTDRERKRLARAQRALNRKCHGSSNREKARLKVARIHSKIGDRRRDYLHKVTTRLVRENQAVVIEDLAVQNMIKNRRLAQAILDAGWSDLRSMLEYKCAWYGRELIVVDRWSPSSKTCSRCGIVVEKLPLHVREWRCRGCGARHDRDINAARNILAAGLAVSACGADVRPQQGSSPERAIGCEAGTARRESGGNPVLQG